MDFNSTISNTQPWVSVNVTPYLYCIRPGHFKRSVWVEKRQANYEGKENQKWSDLTLDFMVL